MRSQLPREFFIPKNSTKVSDKHSDAVAYIFTNSKGKPAAKVFFGKQSKPVFFYYFKDEAQRTKSVAAAFHSRQEAMKLKASYRAERTAASRGLVVGDVLRASWGYDQTNVDYYEVVALVGKNSVDIRPIASKCIETGNMSGKCAPLKGEYTGPAVRKLARNGSVKMGHHSAHKMEPKQTVAGVPVYEGSYYSYYA